MVNEVDLQRRSDVNVGKKVDSFALVNFFLCVCTRQHVFYFFGENFFRSSVSILRRLCVGQDKFFYFLIFHNATAHR